MILVCFFKAASLTIKDTFDTSGHVIRGWQTPARIVDRGIESRLRSILVVHWMLLKHRTGWPTRITWSLRPLTDEGVRMVDDASRKQVKVSFLEVRLCNMFGD